MEQDPRYRATPNLSDVLAIQGRTKAWIAREIGLTGTHVLHIVAGRRTVAERHADQISRMLGVPLFLLFELADTSDMLAPAGGKAA